VLLSAFVAIYQMVNKPAWFGDGRSPRNRCFSFFRFQHPLSDTPAISLRFAEPPSVDGIGGGQIGEGAVGAVAVVLAAWVDVFGISPGNSKGACETPEPEPEFELVAPVAPLADPVVVGDSDGVPNCDAGEGDDTDGKAGVGKPRGSDPTALSLLSV
jgi:hypothetical protein